ncbi:MAG: TAXI family TRAP transporter solute-binding subunit [Sporichthyaceae bacterium]
MRNSRYALLATASLVALAGCGGNTAKQPAAADPAPTSAGDSCTPATDQRLALATGNATGVYFALGTALAEQVAQATGNKIRVTAAETGASVQNIEQLVAGDYQVAFSLLDTASDALAGRGAFEGKPASIAAIARTHTNYTHVVVRKAAKIASLADLKGKRVSTGSPKSGTEVIANRLLEAAGLNPDSDVQTQRLDLTKTVDGMKSGQIDALFWSGGLPTPGIKEMLLTAKDDYSFLDVTGELVDLQKLSPAYQAGSIPAGTYVDAAPAIATIVVPNVLLVRPDLAAPTACALTKALLDRRTELAAVNAAAKELDPARVGATSPIPLHPGAAEAIAAAGGSTAAPSPAATASATPSTTPTPTATPTGTATGSPSATPTSGGLGVSADLNLPGTN